MDPAGLALRLAAELERLLESLDEAARRVRGRPDRPDPEAIHDLRVATRRLGEALATWRALLVARPAAAARRRLRDLRRRIGAVRDAEVQREDLAARRTGAELPLRLALEPVLRRIERRIARGRGAAARRASAGRIEAIRQRVRAAADGLASRVIERPDPRQAAMARAGRRREEARSALGLAAGPESGDGLFHAARIAIKKDRYASEALGAVDPSGAPGLVDPQRLGALRRVQRSLGIVHDRAELLALLDRMMQRWQADGQSERAQTLAPLLERVGEEQRTALLRARRSILALAEASASPAPSPAPRAPDDPAGGPEGGFAGAPPTLRVVRPPGRRRES